MKQLLCLCASGIVTAQVASSAIISLYQFEGSTADSVRGAGFGAQLVDGQIAYTAGKSGQAFSFNGSTIIKAPVAGAGLSQFSFSAWVNFQELTTWGTILKNWGSPDAGAFHLGLDQNPNIISSYLGGSNGVEAAYYWEQVVTDAWYHVGVTIGQTNQNLYVNGIPVASSGTPGVLNGNFSFMSFGGKLNNDQNAISDDAAGWLNGYLDDVAFFDQELTPEQMSQVYSAGLTGDGIATLGYQAVPEPGSCFVLASMLSGGLMLRQRRRVQRD